MRDKTPVTNNIILKTKTQPGGIECSEHVLDSYPAPHVRASDPIIKIAIAVIFISYHLLHAS